MTKEQAERLLLFIESAHDSILYLLREIEDTGPVDLEKDDTKTGCVADIEFDLEQGLKLLNSL